MWNNAQMAISRVEGVSERFSTATVDHEHRWEYWAQQIRSLHGDADLRHQGGADPSGVIHVRKGSQAQLVAWRSRGQMRLTRARAQVDRAPDAYAVVTPLSGTCELDQSGVSRTGRPGRLLVLDHMQPFEFVQHGASSMLILTVPRFKLAIPHVPRIDLLEQMDLTRGIGRVVLRQMRETCRAESLALAEIDILLRQLSELLTVATDGLDEDINGSTTARARKIKQIEAYIQDGLSDPALATPQIAAALHLSPRYVQLLMSSAGNRVRDYIRLSRLERAHGMLADPSLRRSTITEIALACGFTSSGTFSTAFRSRYGVRPKDVRSTLTETPGNDPGNVP